METQSAVAVPEEGREMTVYASTQSPDGIQTGVARLLGVQKNQIIVKAKRLGYSLSTTFSMR